LFEWTIILYKNGKIKEAEKKAILTFFGNTYLFDKYFNRPITQEDKYEGSNWESPSLAARLEYSCDDEELKDFGEWLNEFISSDRFTEVKNKFIEISKRLKGETDFETRHYLVMQIHQLRETM